MDTQYLDALASLGACDPALDWVATQPDPETAWATCPNGAWMLRLREQLAGTPGSLAHRRLVEAAAACTDLVEAEWGTHDPRDGKAILDSLCGAASPVTTSRKAMPRACADAVRRHYPTPPTLEELESAAQRKGTP